MDVEEMTGCLRLTMAVIILSGLIGLVLLIWKNVLM